MSTIRVAVAFSLHLMTRKSSAAHTKDFCEKNLPKLPNFEGFFFEIAVSRIVSSGLSRYSRILRFFLLFASDMWPNLLAPLVDIAKNEHPGLMSVACYQMSNRPVLGGYEKKSEPDMISSRFSV
jgi:hypothetical protein